MGTLCCASAAISNLRLTAWSGRESIVKLALGQRRGLRRRSPACQALRRLAEEAEDAADEADARRLHDDHLAAKARGAWLSMPAAQWDRIREGASPVRAIREFRGLTQTRLAEESGVDQSQISAMENRRRTGTAATLKAIAKALGAPLEALVADDRG